MISIIFYPFYRLYLIIRALPYYVLHPRLMAIDFLVSLYSLWRWILICLKRGLKWVSGGDAADSADFDDDALVYGELSYSGLFRVFSQLQLPARSTIVDLGAGYGKVLFYSALSWNYIAVGLERVSSYVCFFDFLKRLLRLSSVTMLKRNIFYDEIPVGDVYIISGTCFSDRGLSDLADRLVSLAPEASFVSLSSPLAHTRLQVLNEFDVVCSWGRSCVYVQGVV